jgi:hypothetical protein
MGVSGVGNSPEPPLPLGPTSQQLRAANDVDKVEQALEDLNYDLDPNNKMSPEERLANVQNDLQNIKDAFLDMSEIQGGLTPFDVKGLESLELAFNANIPHNEGAASELIQLYDEDPGAWGKVIGMVAGQATALSADMKAGY